MVLPDGARHQVGSGEHAWTVIAPLSRAEAQHLSLRSRLAQIIDDPEGYRVLVDVLVRDGPGGQPTRCATTPRGFRAGRSASCSNAERRPPSDSASPTSGMPSTPPVESKSSARNADQLTSHDQQTHCTLTD